jgi:hypothetical protein
MKKELIAEINEKIIWQEAESEDIREKGDMTNQKLLLMKENGVDEDSEEYLRVSLLFDLYKDIYDALRTRVYETNCIIKSIENPQDVYLRTHSSTRGSDTMMSRIRENWTDYLCTAGEKYPWIQQKVNELELELRKTVNHKNFELDYTW